VTVHDATRQEEFAEIHITEAPAVYGPRIFQCIVWDLDNTLWEGTLADAGPLGVRIRRAAVEAIETTDCRGILHSIASHNDYESAMSVLRGNGMEDYFVFPQINARAKSESIHRIAQRLHIAMDAIAFVDDQELERAKVQAALPGITVIDSAHCVRIPDRPECMIPRTAATEHLRDAVRDWQRKTGYRFSRGGAGEGRRRMARARRAKTVEAISDFDPLA
jgi:FkbH-like protein